MDVQVHIYREVDGHFIEVSGRRVLQREFPGLFLFKHFDFLNFYRGNHWVISEILTGNAVARGGFRKVHAITKRIIMGVSSDDLDKLILDRYEENGFPPKNKINAPWIEAKLMEFTLTGKI